MLKLGLSIDLITINRIIDMSKLMNNRNLIAHLYQFYIP